MHCERCPRDEATATYRVFTGIIDMKVCAACADEARKLGINVSPLILSKGKNEAKHFDGDKERTISQEAIACASALHGESIAPEARQALSENRLKDALVRSIY